MTEHSIEELERQLQAAEARLADARNAVSNAKERLADARLLATGLKGHLVRGRRWRSSPEYTILAEKIQGWRNDEVGGRVLKKDGTIGVQFISLLIEYIADLGPYEPTP